MKRHLLFLVSIFCALSAMAQDMKTVFVAMPDSVTSLLTKVNREDCIDFLASDMKAVVKNRFGNVAEMKVLTDDCHYHTVAAPSEKLLDLIQEELRKKGFLQSVGE